MKSSDSIANDILIRDLQSDDYHIRWFAAEVLGTKRDLTVEQVALLSEMALQSDVGEVLIWGLGMMRAHNVEELIGRFLEHPDNYFRWRAAEALRDLGTTKAIDVLTTYLNTSRELETRWKCAWALGEIGDIRSFEHLWKAAEHDVDRYVRWKSIWGITRLKGDVERLVKKKYESETLSDFMAWRVAWILSQVGDEQTIGWLESMKRDRKSSKYVNYQIALSISAIKGRI